WRAPREARCAPPRHARRAKPKMQGVRADMLVKYHGATGASRGEVSPVNWLQPAMIFMAMASAVFSATFLYVWASCIRRRSALLWSLAWLVAIPNTAFAWVLMNQPSNHLVWGTGQVLLVLNASLMAAGCFDFVHRRLPLAWLALLTSPFLLWAVAAPLVTD